MLKNLLFLNDKNIDEYVKQDKITILNFYLWGELGCRRQISLIREFAEKYGEKYNVAVVNVPESPQTCAICDIQKLPAIAIVRQGMIIGGRYGGLSKDTEEDLLKNLDIMQNMPMEEHLKYNKEPLLSL
jgi:thioredoxin-like negative regulator of GroEL